MTANDSMEQRPPIDNKELNDSYFTNQLRQDMVKFASIQLNDTGLAEDAVQEALISAYKNASSFNRKAAFKTWVFAILKNKIIDLLRKNSKEISDSELINDNNDSLSDSLFNKKGFWQPDERPVGWSMPMEALKEEQFWAVFELCVSALPDRLCRPFMMREYIEMDSKEICQTLGLSQSNLHVLLYRARLRLRECLENKWFKEERPV